MRKKLFIAAGVVLFLLLCFFGWLQYRQYSSWKVPVHRDIYTVAKINTDDLAWNFIKEYGLNFSKQIKKTGSNQPDSAKNTGIYFPGNIFIYNISSRLPTTLFCSLPVHDLDDFKAYIKNRMDILLSDSAGILKGVSADGKITIACNQNYISLAWSKEKEEVISVLTQILGNTHTMAQHELLAGKLKKDNSLLSITNGVYNINVDVDGREMLLHASLDSFRNITIPAAWQHRTGDQSSSTYFFANFYPAAALFKPQYTIRQYAIEPDSVLKYFNGYADMEIGPVIKQTDTITTYGYDDNFEKVEKQTFTEVKVPSVRISLLMKPGILDYLQKREFVTSELKLNKEIFPLYNVNVSYSGGLLHLNTNDAALKKPGVFSTANAFAAVDIAPGKMIASLGIPSLQEYVKNIRRIKITGKKQDGNILIDAGIYFENAAIRDILHIIKN